MEAKTKSVLIISVDRKEQEMIEDYAKHSSQSSGFTKLKVHTTASFGQDSAWWAKNTPDVLILNLPEDSILQSQFLIKLRADVPKTIPLLLICEVVTSGIMHMTTLFSKIRFVKGHFDQQNFFRGLNDLFADFAPGRQSAAPRFPTNQPATVNKIGSSEQMTVTLKNMSNSGSYFESESNPIQLGIDELVKIQVTISGIREYSFEAKVVWYKALESGRFGFGVTFVNYE